MCARVPRRLATLRTLRQNCSACSPLGTKADRLYSAGRCFITRANGAGSDQRVDPAVGEARRRYRVSARAGRVLREVLEANNDQIHLVSEKRGWVARR